MGRNYQEIMDDSPPTLATSFGSLVAALRPDRALSATPVDSPRELFKHQWVIICFTITLLLLLKTAYCHFRPIEAAVVLLPMYDLLHYNSVFRDIFRRSLTPLMNSPATAQFKTPYPHSLLCLSSYLLTHASSTSAPRALAYARLALTILLVVVEDDAIVNALCQSLQPERPDVRLCRQVCSLLWRLSVTK